MPGLCYLFKELPPDGGGNKVSNPEFIVRRNASIGDCVAASVVAMKLKEQGHGCIYQCHPHIHSVVRHIPYVEKLDSPRGFAHVNLDGCYERNPQRRSLHFTECFTQSANHQLQSYGVVLSAWNCRPSLVLDPETIQISKAKFTDHPRPWIFVCPRSNSYRVRQVSDGFWLELAKELPGTKMWLGQHPAPEGYLDLKLQSLTPLVAWLSAADMLVSVDTGPAHIGIALGIPAVLLGQSSSPELHFSDQRDFETVWPEGELQCLNCQLNVCPVLAYSPPCQKFSVSKVARLIKSKLNPDTVTALIPTFRPDDHHLHKAISNVASQVDEVVVCCAADAVVPALDKLPNLRLVRSPKANLGFGKNVNFGFRHTSSKWVLLLNDDCYLNGGTVELLKNLRNEDVGIIAHLLRYPSGKIYFAGRTRRPGERGFPHLSHGEYHPQITTPTEMEAVSCTSVLINRKAFYDIGGFDERFHLYAEDDDISMRMRQAGYKLLYHPTALGVHEGSMTAKKTHNIMAEIRKSGGLMEQLWGWYWTKNRTTIPGVFK